MKVIKYLGISLAILVMILIAWAVYEYYKYYPTLAFQSRNLPAYTSTLLVSSEFNNWKYFTGGPNISYCFEKTAEAIKDDARCAGPNREYAKNLFENSYHYEKDSLGMYQTIVTLSNDQINDLVNQNLLENGCVPMDIRSIVAFYEPWFIERGWILQSEDANPYDFSTLNRFKKEKVTATISGYASEKPNYCVTFTPSYIWN